MREPGKPAIKPLVADASSVLYLKISCTAPIGKEEFGKADSTNPNPIFTASPFARNLRPYKGRISFCNRAMISDFFCRHR
jgi:hypothetical protein